jgi:hypothetical protein
MLYNGKSYGNGWAYICNRFPKCRGSVGVHPNGKPLGTIPDQETKQLRIQLHAVIDPLWRNQTHQPKRVARGAVYGYLRHIMEMTAEECHIGNFTADDCRRAMRAIQEIPFEVRDV